MTELVIFLEDIDPVVFYGTNNFVLDRIRRFFPKIKIIARGNELKCMGEEAEIALFAERFNEMLEYYRKYHRFDEEDIEKYFFDAEHMKSASDGQFEEVIVFGTSGRPIRARTVNQLNLVNLYRTNDLIIAEGPAGTGKTYLAVAMAVKAFKAKDVSRIVLTRPAVEAGEKLGFLPGDMQEKVNPYLRPLFDGLLDMFGPEEFIRLQQKGQIEVAPLAYMRGRTLEKSFVILDEAQNTTVEQLKMFLTRLGDRSKMVINGDIESVIFTEDDVVRHDLVAAIIHAYEEDTKKKRQGVEDNGNHD